MGRLARKKYTEEQLQIKGQGGIFDAFDDVIKYAYRVNDEEFDRLLVDMTDDEMTLILEESPTFAQKRAKIELLNKYLPELV